MKFIALLLSAVLGAGTPQFIGDSLLTQMRPSLEQVGTVRAYSGSGLVNPTIHNWLADKTRTDGPVVVVLGTNDAQSIHADREWFHVGTDEWHIRYEDRVKQIMHRGRPMLWVLPPRVGSVKFDHRLEAVRRSIRATAVLMEVEVLDTQELFGEQKGFNPVMHSKDRIHLSNKAVKILSKAIQDWVSK